MRLPPTRVFERRRRRERPRRLRGLTINRLLPNVLTLTALASGMTAIRFAYEGVFTHAVLAIAVAAVFDALDGRIARLLKAQSQFGAELDSLADIVSFGVAPALVLYFWTLQEARSVGWIVAVLLGVCCALRLARFNTAMGAAAEKPPWAYNYFTGVPSPAAAGLALLPLTATLEVGPGWFDSPWVVAPWALFVAALMISALPTFSLKGQRVPQGLVVFVLLGVGLLVAGLASAPWATLTVVGLLYLGSLPFSQAQYARLQREARRLTEESTGRTDDPVPSPPPSGATG